VSTAPAAPRDPAALLAVAVGGAIGGLARYALAEALPRQEYVTGTGLDAVSGTVWPWATFITNLIGCLLIGLVVHALLVHPAVLTHAWVDRLARPFLVVGLLGGFTTFSALGAETLDLISAGRASLAVTYIVASVVLGVLAVAGSGSLARRWMATR
jgi:CrcB protein